MSCFPRLVTGFARHPDRWQYLEFVLRSRVGCGMILLHPGGSNMAVSAKIATRISTQLKKYQTILKAAQQRDISEADTVTIITDMLADVFGYDEYKEVTSEHSIRGTSVDLAVTVGEKSDSLSKPRPSTLNSRTSTLNRLSIMRLTKEYPG